MCVHALNGRPFFVAIFVFMRTRMLIKVLVSSIKLLFKLSVSVGSLSVDVVARRKTTGSSERYCIFIVWLRGATRHTFA